MRDKNGQVMRFARSRVTSLENELGGSEETALSGTKDGRRSVSSPAAWRTIEHLSARDGAALKLMAEPLTDDGRVRSLIATAQRAAGRGAK